MIFLMVINPIFFQFEFVYDKQVSSWKCTMRFVMTPTTRGKHILPFSQQQTLFDTKNPGYTIVRGILDYNVEDMVSARVSEDPLSSL